MIASVVAHLDLSESTLAEALQSFDGNPHIELGQLIDGRLLPMTIEANSGEELDEIHHRLCSLNAVDFIDVVYVHLEDTTSTPVPPTSANAAISETP